MEKQQKETEFGYIYILKNECMPGLIKIGKTKQTDYGKRIKALNRETGVPVPFEEVHVSKVLIKDCDRLEIALHKAFDTDRVNRKREFFEMEAWRAIAILELFEVEDVTNTASKETTADLAPQEIEAREKAIEKTKKEEYERRHKRPVLNFSDLGIAAGEHLAWKDDPNKIVTVADDRKVIYDGELCYLTAATSKILGIQYGVQPTPYWKRETDGRILKDIYDEKYAPIDIAE